MAPSSSRARTMMRVGTEPRLCNAAIMMLAPSRFSQKDPRALEKLKWGGEEGKRRVCVCRREEAKQQHRFDCNEQNLIVIFRAAGSLCLSIIILQLSELALCACALHALSMRSSDSVHAHHPSALLFSSLCLPPIHLSTASPGLGVFPRCPTSTNVILPSATQIDS